MKYRVKHIVNKYPISSLLFWVTEYCIVENWDIQYKKHWWNKWKTCDSYDHIEDAYINLINYETDGKCILENK